MNATTRIYNEPHDKGYSRQPKDFPRPMFTPSLPPEGNRRRNDPDRYLDNVTWFPVKMMAVAFLATLAMVVFAPNQFDREGAMMALFVFAVALNFSILLPISNIILHWNHSLFGHHFRL